MNIEGPGRGFDRVEEIFALVADLPPGERAAALARECGGDPALRAEVASLIAASEGSSTFVRDVVSEEAGELAGAKESAWIGRRLGPWRITGVLGRGGMGAVYEARRDDGAFRQRVAVKMIRAGLDSETGRRRFLDERQILAHLNHPNIARLLDGGETADGMPYLVMEAIDGISITSYCDERALSIEARLRLFSTVCRAVHSAHTQLIVHRDLKPSNILVDAEGKPTLVDFGIAKLIDPLAARSQTLIGELALTPDYASPEQVRSEPATTVTDVYSLGAVLYELLTGSSAHVFDRYTLPEFTRVICEVESGPPSAVAPPRLQRRLRGDLDNIVLTALRKDPARRYASAEQFAEDLDRHLEGRPVHARASSWRYRAGKFIARNRAGVAAAVVVLLALLGGIAGTMWQARRAERRFREVRSLANTFLFTFHDAIRDLPGSTPARELIVKTALEYLDNLASDARNDASLQLELAAAYEKVGDVLGNPSNPNLGRTDEAMKSYQKSLQLRLAAAGDKVDRADEGRAVLQSHLKMADILIGAGKTDESEAHTKTALALAKKFGTPDDLLQVHKREGELSLRRGDLVPAEAAYVAAMGIARAEAAQKPGLESTALVANVASRLGYVYKMSSRQTKCLETLGVALEETRRLSAAEPAKTSHIRQIIRIHDDRGDALRSPFASEGMHPDLSLREYEESLRQGEWLVKSDPADFSARLSVFLSRAQVADTWREIEPARSLTLFRDLFPMGEALGHDDPSNFQVNWISSLLRYAYADAIQRTGDLQAALPVYDDAVGRIMRMSETDRGRKISRRDRIKVHAERGAVRLRTGDVAGAATDSEVCLPLADSFVVKESRPIDLRDIAYCYELAGDVAMRRQKATVAMAHFDEALVRWKEFGRRRLDSAFLREHLASAERRRAEAESTIAPAAAGSKP
jgi:tetratricopeptide (TPR) repeat protein/tRNA A-37 threonylcarbamoyl transferase component Bud32